MNLSLSLKSHIAFRVVLFVVIVVSSICETTAKPNSRHYLKQGDIEFGRNNLTRAILNYTKAIQLEPTLAEAYVKRGIARRAKGSLNGAIRDFEKAESLNAQIVINNRYVADAYSNRGYIEMNALDVDEAILDFTRAIHCYADSRHYHRRGQARLLTEDFDGAIEDFNSALSLNPHNDFLTSMIYADRGYALLLQGKDKSARADLQRDDVGPGRRLVIELHLRSLENQIKLIRRRRLAFRRVD